ncbi:DUF397 domain-containing protein [Amycolatopsis solani]|uniref:DUF397 domain-containing protein n=1 Tax=Amycolatopsis solani TaxID=3028615 RepID=UPI0025AF21C7|nr:DUF397 domain-containing protein [Amycolatopsis sp. MEP2-6]
MTGRSNSINVEAEQLGLVWHRSSRCSPTHDPKCVEVAFDGEIVRIRDSKTPHSGELHLNHQSWTAFVRHLDPST